MSDPVRNIIPLDLATAAPTTAYTVVAGQPVAGDDNYICAVDGDFAATDRVPCRRVTDDLGAEASAAFEACFITHGVSSTEITDVLAQQAATVAFEGVVTAVAEVAELGIAATLQAEAAAPLGAPATVEVAP